MSKLQEYNFEIRYIPEGNNARADCLSRLPLEHANEESDYLDLECVVEGVDVIEVCQGVIRAEEWNKACAEDLILLKAVEYVQKRWPPLKHLQRELHCYGQIAPQLTVESGILLRAGKFIAPNSLKSKISSCWTFRCHVH